MVSVSRRYPEPYDTYPPEDRKSYSARSGFSYGPPERHREDWSRDSYYDHRGRYERSDYAVEAYTREEYERHMRRREREMNHYEEPTYGREYFREYDRHHQHGRRDYRDDQYYRSSAEHRGSRSPIRERRSPPSYPSRVAPVSPVHERRDVLSRRPSSYGELERNRNEPAPSQPPPRDESIPTGPRSLIGGALPTAPRALTHSNRRAPPASISTRQSDRYGESSGRYVLNETRSNSGDIALQDHNETYGERMQRIASSDKPEVGSAQSLDIQARRVSKEKVENGYDSPLSSSEVKKGSSDIGKTQSPALAPSPAPVAIAKAVEVAPSLSIADKLGNLKEEDFPYHCCAKYEAEAFNTSTERIRSDSQLYSTSQYVAYRQALVALADGEIELVGARTRSSVTAEALQRAKEDAEAWSLESARIEASEKNVDPSSFFVTQTANTVS